ncbi:hypothetical protein Poli38472_010922 [Pythium oligandrum]|uniref:Protein kinase domain-containing protein n=1 Tax=Pythium oligandrum TaxID=41045 RepID=A0A8K1FIA0_PYTOL|nr:hypothetical protein Poli38472_010922 [Pythium oligandrum]|eukprot:TMW61859.1 hypothetical protein Poli38472_010922 [Pythium oligandrum]
MVNASLVQTWSSDDLSAVPKFALYSGLNMYEVPNYDYGPYIPPIETIEMELPENLYAAKWNATNIGIIGIECPEFPSEPQHYDALETLRMEDCGLTEFAWGKSTAPNLERLFIGNNRIKELPSLPAALQTIDLSGNLLKAVPPSLKDLKNLTSVHLRHNPLGNIDAKAFPAPMSGYLILKNTSMTRMPLNLNRLTELSELSLSYNNLGDNFDVSKLPPALTTLEIAYCGLTKLPKFAKESTLDMLDISGNAIAVEEYAKLPATITQLTLENAGLKRIPPVSSGLKLAIVLELANNPIERIEAGDIPDSVRKLVLNNTSLTTTDIAYTALPLGLTTVNITFSQLEEIPEYLLIANTQKQILNLAHNKIKTINRTTALRVYLQYNEIEEYDDAAAYAKLLDLSFNKLRSFKTSGADDLKVLVLRGNNLITVPDSLISLRNLQVLDLRDNPITNYVPSPQEWDFFQRVPVVMMDASQLRSNCKDIVQFKENVICNPEGSLEPASSSSDESDPDPPVRLTNGSSGSSVSTVAIALILIGVALLVVIAGFMWYLRRKRLALSKPNTTDVTTESSVRSENEDIMLWNDEELLRHRVDPKLLQVERLLAGGTYGEVFLATYEGQRVVIKRLKDRDSSRAEIQQFVSEIKMMATFRFPKIVRFVGVVWTKESDIGVLTEYMENGDLRAYLDKNKQQARDGWTVGKLRIALDIAEALVYLHSLDPPMVHRDLKSRNVLLDKDMTACLSDFGTTRAADESSTMTTEVGTALWMAPEVLSGQRYDQSADIYSLGVILSELDTHELPFQGDDRLESMGTSEGTFIMGLVGSGSLRVKFLLSCPPDIVKLGTQCTDPDPAGRPSTLEAAYTLRTLLRQQMQPTSSRNSATSTHLDSSADTADPCYIPTILYTL